MGEGAPDGSLSGLRSLGDLVVWLGTKMPESRFARESREVPRMKSTRLQGATFLGVGRFLTNGMNLANAEFCLVVSLGDRQSPSR